MACILSLAKGEGLMGRMNWMPDTTIAAAWLIFLATYAVVALGKIPVYRIDRAGAALLDASLMIATGVLSLDEAYRAVDNTIVLLLGMMIVVANLRLSGFFRVITAGHVRRPITLPGMVIFSSGVLSAFLVNDTICLVTTPLVLELLTRLKRNPIPIPPIAPRCEAARRGYRSTEVPLGLLSASRSGRKRSFRRSSALILQEIPRRDLAMLNDERHPFANPV
jgi:citrate transporter